MKITSNQNCSSTSISSSNAGSSNAGSSNAGSSNAGSSNAGSFSSSIRGSNYGSFSGSKGNYSGRLKLLLVSLNSRHIHSSFAAWRLKAACDAAITKNGCSHITKEGRLETCHKSCHESGHETCHETCGKMSSVELAEYTINDSTENILRDLYSRKPDIAAFSCYIWNMEQVAGICQRLKVLLPDIMILFGGPEVSYNPYEVIKKNRFVNAVLCGEGETLLSDIVLQLCSNISIAADCGSRCLLLSSLKRDGLVIQEADGKITGSPIFQLERDFDNLPSPYTPEMLESSKGKIIYIESTRGCPFSCTYCLSSTFSGVRVREIENVKKDLALISNTEGSYVKFVDRTFNYDNARTIEIWNFVSALETDKCFHFEVDAALLSSEQIHALKNAPKGRIQIEAGIQTTNRDSLKAVCRREDQQQALDGIREVAMSGNVHVHASLICALPFDNKQTFSDSLKDVFDTTPHQIQLGFLKLLNGSRIRQEASEHGYSFDPFPPYEVYSSNWMSSSDIWDFKDISFIIENFWNSARAKQLLIYAHSIADIEFLKSAAQFFRESGLLARKLSPSELYEAMFDFVESYRDMPDPQFAKELLLFDCLKKEGPKGLPDRIIKNFGPSDEFKMNCRKILSDKEAVKKLLPHYYEMEPRVIARRVWFQQFNYPVALMYLNANDISKNKNIYESKYNERYTFLFDTGSRDKVTGLFNHTVLEAHYDLQNNFRDGFTGISYLYGKRIHEGQQD